jgi:hypothetical protein
VATDLKRIQRFYGSPSDVEISVYEQELIVYLKAGLLDEVTYGFKKNGNWIEPTINYKAKDLVGLASANDDPGRIRPGANISGASFCSYLIKNAKYYNLSLAERESFARTLPLQRIGGPTPGINGYMTCDKSYTAGGISLDRSSLKSY